MSGSPSLEEITLEIIEQCYQNCVHCSSSATRDSRQKLTKDEVSALTEDFVKLGGKKIEISGGEPFLHKDLFDFISFFGDMGLSVEVYTCGKISKKADSDILLDDITGKLKRLRVKKIVFSLHGAKAETHDAITRTNNSFSQATKFIKRLVDAGLYIAIHYVPMSPNFEEFEDLVDYGARLGVKEIGILRFVPQGRGAKYRDWLSLSKEESARLIKLLAESKKRKDVRVRIGSTWILLSYWMANLLAIALQVRRNA